MLFYQDYLHANLQNAFLFWIVKTVTPSKRHLKLIYPRYNLKIIKKMLSDFMENMMFSVAYTLGHWDACDRDSRCPPLRPPRPHPRRPARPCRPPPLSACSSRTAAAAVPPTHCRRPPGRLSAAPPALQSRQPWSAGGHQRRYDMNGRSQMQGSKSWVLPKGINANRFFWVSHWLEIWKSHKCSSMGPRMEGAWL